MALSVIALEARHDVIGFECGTPALTAWLQQTARQYGFTPLPSNPLTLFMPIADIPK